MKGGLAVQRPYLQEDVARLRGSIKIEYTLANMGSRKLRESLSAEGYVRALGALTGHHAVQQVQGGLKAIYCSGWQVAADANTSGETYPDQSLYPVDSVPNLVRRINKAFQRADQIDHSQGKENIDWFAPIVADAEAGFGGPLNAFELMRHMIEAGASAVHFEDQLASAKKCGHLGGKVIVPTWEFIQKLVAARLASDVMGVPTLIIARTDANGAKLLSSDIDERDHSFLRGQRTTEGFYQVKSGLEMAIARGLAYAPYADLVWCETSKPNLEEARKFAEAIHDQFPGRWLAYNCSPSFNWRKNLNDADILKFQDELGAMGYKFQFVTLAGFHALNYSMFRLAKEYAERGMAGYVDLQESEFEAKPEGYAATEHQSFVGTGYFDEIATLISGGTSSTLALHESTEKEQF